MKTKIYTTILLLVIGFNLNAQNVAISNDNSTPDPSAMLEVKSTNKGILIPRVALLSPTQPVENPVEGLLIYNNDASIYPKGFYYWTGSIWNQFTTQGDIQLSLDGNTLSVSGGNSVNLSAYLPLTETQVDDYVANNGYLTTEIDSSVTNEIQNLQLSGDTLYLSESNSVDLSAYLPLNETEVDGYVANNGYLTNESSILWQKKHLAADATSSGLIADLEFNNLEIGKTYRITVHCVGNQSLEGKWSEVETIHNTNVILRTTSIGVINGGNAPGNSSSTIFTATATTLTQYYRNISADALIGYGNDSGTWVILEELPNHAPTSQWN